ncbi:hypothetical protein [Mesorhizobium sp.]|uniref:hypothetical protein n=1 Tax=Mesorhizobium sp. TaxID=1871066 RepID=UPI0025C345FB|nr:hypothetical protein [Mesorhizobium sp.]
MGLYLAMPDRIEANFGPVSGSYPLFILAVYAPAIAAVVLVLHHGGIAGLKAFLSRLLLWRMAAGWWAFLLLGIPAVYFLDAALAARWRAGPEACRRRARCWRQPPSCWSSARRRNSAGVDLPCRSSSAGWRRSGPDSSSG